MPGAAPAPTARWRRRTSIVLWGSNARETHPIFFHHVLRGVHNGARLYAVDPRRTSSAQWADAWLGLDVGSDIALANAVGREIIAAGLHDEEFIRRATTGFEEYRARVDSYTLEYAERETGVPAALIRELAHAYATAPRAMICWTLGITEHHNAVDNVISLISLALLTGHVGRWGSGLNPLRGQNNVQGGGDMGALPDRLPGFQHVENDPLRARFDAAWGVTVPPKRGWNLTGMFHAMERGELTALYVIGENPVQSEADQGEGDRGPLGPRAPRRPGHLPDEDGAARRRRPPGRGRLGRDRGHRHQLRAARPAGAQGAASRPARPATTWRSSSTWRAGWAPRPPPGASPSAEAVWNELRTLSPVHAGHELRPPRSRGRAPVALLRREPPRRARSSTRGSGRTRSRGRARPSSPSTTTRRSTASTPTSRSA